MIRIPQTVSSLAHTTAGDVSRVTTALSGVTTRAALISADLALKRAADNVRELRSQVRVLKRGCV